MNTSTYISTLDLFSCIIFARDFRFIFKKFLYCYFFSSPDRLEGVPYLDKIIGEKVRFPASIVSPDTEKNIKGRIDNNKF